MLEGRMGNEAVELAEKRMCIQCKGKMDFQIDLFGEIVCTGICDQARLVDFRDLHKIRAKIIQGDR